MLDLRALLRALVSALPLLVCAALLYVRPSLADARAEQANTDVETAERAYSALDYDAANTTAARALKKGGLTRDQLVRAQRVLALSHGALGHDAEAKEAAVLLLAYDPTFNVDPDDGPKVQLPVLEARGYWKAQPSAPGIETALVLPPDEPGTLRVTTRDPLHVVARVTAAFRWGPVGIFTSQTVAASAGATVVIPRAPVGTTRLDYYVQAFDVRDNVVFEAGNPETPKSGVLERLAPADRPRERGLLASPWFWIVGGALVAGGATVAVVAASSPGTKDVFLPPDRAALAPVFRCGAAVCP